MATLKEKIAVMQAALDGEQIEFRSKSTDSPVGWIPVRERGGDTLEWRWGLYEYRIKPEPLTVWVNIYESRLGTPYCSKEEAEANSSCGLIRTAKFIEVIE